jgi:archaellum component FlaD/FlaE
MSLTIRNVSDGVNVEEPLVVHEHFIKLLYMESTTGHDLCDVLVNELEKLELNFKLFMDNVMITMPTCKASILEFKV